MPIAVIPALIPDIPRIYEIYFDAFKNDMMGRIMVDILFPGGKVDTPEFREGHAKATLDWWHKSDVQYTVKCVDTDTGDILGMGLGDGYFKERTPEERKFHGCTWLEGKERERADGILMPLAEMREKLWGGQRYIYIHVIAVDPKHQGRRVGKALVQWGIDTGEACALPVYFESSPSTVRLYEKMGFVRLKEKLSHKGKLLGMPLISVDVPLMVRMPSAAGDMTFEEWRAAGYPKFGSKEARAAVEAGKAGLVKTAVDKTTSAAVAGSPISETKTPVVTSFAAGATDAAKVNGVKKHWWKRLSVRA